MTDHRYLLPNAASASAERFAAFAELFDPSTFAHMVALGITGGWRCWEVGAGGTSVVEWLAGRVGREGHVLATDIDVTQAAAAVRDSAPQIEVRTHDVAGDPVPQGPFDLVHARLVLVHVAERETALANMVAALRPGGWLFVEDADPMLQPLSVLEERSPAEALANRLRNGFRALMATRAVDLAYGRTAARVLREAGLAQVRADAFFPVTHPACARLETATIHLIGDQLLENGIATREDIARHLDNVAAGRLDLAQPPLIAAWGRRPLPGTQAEARAEVSQQAGEIGG